MTLLTLPTVVLDPFSRRRSVMRVVTRSTAETILACRPATAGLQLLNMADGRRGQALLNSRLHHEGQPDIRQPIARTEIELATSVTDNPIVSSEVALLADGFALRVS